MSPALESPGRRPRKPPAEQVSGRFFYIYQSLGTTGLGQLRLQKKKSYCLDSSTAAKKTKAKSGH